MENVKDVYDKVLREVTCNLQKVLNRNVKNIKKVLKVLGIFCMYIIFHFLLYFVLAI